VGQGNHRLGREQGIAKLAPGVGASGEAAVEVCAKGAQGFTIMSGHAAPLARLTG
jgi:hypothetical protein